MSASPTELESGRGLSSLALRTWDKEEELAGTPRSERELTALTSAPPVSMENTGASFCLVMEGADDRDRDL